MSSVNMHTLDGLPNIKHGDDLPELIYQQLASNNQSLIDGDVLVVAQKVVSKAEGATCLLSDITPTADAIELANKVNKDPRKVAVILSESKRVVKVHKHPNANEGILITEHKLGHISANAAVDESNTDQADQLILLPKDPDASARHIADYLGDKFNCHIGVIISDTFGRPWRLGQTNVAIGVANVPAVIRMEGDVDAWGRPLTVTAPAFADEIAAASGLLMSKQGKCPVILFRGLRWQSDPFHSAQDLLRPTKEDLFA